MIREPDWNPEVLKGQAAAYDDMRGKCPVAYSDGLGWSIFGHQQVSQILHDPETFSSEVSSRLAVPNGMDPPRHTPYRRLVESYFSDTAMQAFEPICRRIAEELVNRLVNGAQVDFMADFAPVFALNVQCAFVGWPCEFREPLRRWIRKSQQASLSGDKMAAASVGLEFEAMVAAILGARRAVGAQDLKDPIDRLMAETIDGQSLATEEIASILRNWTAGELASISAAVGILVEFLARDVTLQQQLRQRPVGLPSAIEEILRIHAPLTSNRRKVSRDTILGGRHLARGDRVTLMWPAANRDEAVFERSGECLLTRDQSANLLWGAGIHICPGVPLARLELRIIMECLLAGTRQWRLPVSHPATPAVYPTAGFVHLPIWVETA